MSAFILGLGGGIVGTVGILAMAYYRERRQRLDWLTVFKVASNE